MIYRIPEVGSTNDEAHARRYRHGDLVWAERQTAGRGQRGHTWTSPEGENLTFSLVVQPRALPAAEQFALLETVALALTDTFRACGIDTRIKWTNDIYAGDRKMAGILIEHKLARGCIARSVAGIGINVNQTAFDPALPNPTSMAAEAGRAFDREAVLAAFAECFEARYAQFDGGGRAALHAAYLERLYRRSGRHLFRLPDGTTFGAVVADVRPTGELVLRHDDATIAAYRFREVAFVVERKGLNG